MEPVLNEEEYKIKWKRAYRKKDQKSFPPSDSYQVSFIIKNVKDHYWVRKKKVYYTEGKDKHHLIEKRWRNDYKGRLITLLNINYL